MSDFNLTITVVSPWEPTPSITEVGGSNNPGGIVNITGAGFSTSGHVYFNTTEATILTWSETLITATIPDLESGVYNVIVDPEGAHNVAIREYTITKSEDIPIGTMQINNGESTTTSMNVSISFTVQNIIPTNMRLRNIGEPWGAWITYTPTVQWTIPTGDGLKTIEAELIEGTTVLALTDSILYDGSLPGEIELTEDDIIIVYGPTVVSVNEDASSDVYRRIN